MNDNNQSIDSTEKKASKHKVSGKRRILVKGAIGAAPAVLTLRSGAAFALTSAEMCVPFSKSQATTDKPNVLAIDDTGPYVREPVSCKTLRPKDSVDPAENFIVYQETPSDWRAGVYPSGTPTPTAIYQNQGAGMEDITTGPPTSKYDIIVDNATCYILVIMDDTGTNIGTGNFIGDPLPYITDSCWASATPAP